MGWLCYPKPQGSLSDHLKAQVTGGVVLRCAFVGRNTWYAAVSVEKDTGTEVFALVILIRYHHSKYGSEICIKDLDEACGPVESRCPGTILDLLTPTDSAWANEWRAKCRRNLALAKERRAQRKGT